MANRDPFRERKWYNMEKGFLIPIVLAFVVPIPFVLSMLSMKIYVSLAMYSATYIFLVYIVITFVRKSRLNAYHIVDPTIISKTINDLQTDRTEEKNKFISTEVSELLSGKKIPVLDVWKTDPQLRSRHIYFQRIVHSAIDPQKEEMELLIQLPTIKIPGKDEQNDFRRQFYSRIAGFLKITATDPRLEVYKDFFSALILECDTFLEDEKGYDIPVPVFSLELSAEQFWRLSTTPQFQEVLFENIGNVRFSDGSEVVPHRMMWAQGN
jgi:hypothetical protein